MPARHHSSTSERVERAVQLNGRKGEESSLLYKEGQNLGRDATVRRRGYPALLVIFLYLLSLLALASLAAVTYLSSTGGTRCSSCLGAQAIRETLLLPYISLSSPRRTRSSTVPPKLVDKAVRSTETVGRRVRPRSFAHFNSEPLHPPEQLHLSFGRSESEYVLSFVTWLKRAERAPGKDKLEHGEGTSQAGDLLVGLVLFCAGREFDGKKCKQANLAYSFGLACLHPRVMFDVSLQLQGLGLEDGSGQEEGRNSSSSSRAVYYKVAAVSRSKLEKSLLEEEQGGATQRNTATAAATPLGHRSSLASPSIRQEIGERPDISLLHPLLKQGETVHSLLDDSSIQWTDYLHFFPILPVGETESSSSLSSAPSSITRFVVFGDMGIQRPGNALEILTRMVLSSPASSSSLSSSSSLLLPPPEFVIHLGDIAYTIYDDEGEKGDHFLRRLSPVSSRLPYVFGAGNHELEGSELMGGSYPSFECRFSQNNYMGKASGSNSPFFFSWNVRGIHFVYLHTDAVIFPAVFYSCYHAQNEWLERDLAAVNRTETPWIVVIGHRGLYCTRDTAWAQECQSQSAFLRWTFEEVLVRHEVDLFVSGHTHHYERSWPVREGGVVKRKSYTNPEGVVHVQPGRGGTAESDGFPDTVYEWEAFRDETLSQSVGYVEVIGGEKLIYRQLRNEDGKVLDAFEIVKSRTGRSEEEQQK